jgi:hypothetical protein
MPHCFIWPNGFKGEPRIVVWQPCLFIDQNKMLTNMATIGNSCFWLVDKKSSVESLGQMNQNLVGSIYGRSSIKIAHFVLIYKQTKFQFIWRSSFRGEVFFQKLINQNQQLPTVTMLVNASGRNEQSL